MKLTRHICLCLFMGLFMGNAFAIKTGNTLSKDQELSQVIGSLEFEEFLNFSPKKYKKLTGKKMGFKNALKLRMAQASAKVAYGGAAIPLLVYIILAFIPFAGAVAMGINDDFTGNNWWIGLILYLLAVLPGIIFTLIKAGDYY